MQKFYSCIFFSVLIITLLSSICLAQDNSATLYQPFIRDGNPDSGTGYLSIINPLNFVELEQIELKPSAPDKVELTPDKKRAFIPHSPFVDNKKGMSVVDLVQKRRIAIMFEGVGVYGVVQSPDGMMWVLLDEPKQIAIVDPRTLNVVKTMNFLSSPRDVLFSQDGRTYISLLNGEIHVFTTSTGASFTIIKNLPPKTRTQLRPQEMTVSNDGNTLYTSGKNIVSIIDTSNRASSVVDSFTVPKPGFGDLILKISPDNKFLYIAGYFSSTLYVYDTVKKEIVKIFDIPLLGTNQNRGNISRLDFSSDGRILYVNQAYGFILLDTETNTFIANPLTSIGVRFPNPFSSGFTLSGDFSIGQAPTLTAISPSTGDNIFANQQITINWQTTVAQQSYALASHKIELSTNGGQSFTTIPGAEELPATAQSFNWTVPNIQSANAQIRVSTVDLGARRAASTTGTFSILQAPPIDNIAPTVTFNSPVGGESFNSGSNLSIAWVSSDNVGVTSQDLSLSTDGGQTFPITIASGLAASVQSFSFPIPQSLSTTQARLRLVVRDAAGNTGQSTTASNFTIAQAVDNVAPTVTISQPSSNQRVIAGSPIQVSWTSTDNRAVVSQALLVSLDGGQNFTQVASLGATANSFVLNNINNLNLDFTTPQAVVRITATDQAGNTGQSNSTFIISPTVTMGSYQQKVLTINGIGFMANVGQGQAQNVQIFVNDSLVNVAPTTANNSSIILKGNKKKLNLVKGANTVRVVVNGVMSNSVSFQF
jgi:hypothetical protein